MLSRREFMTGSGLRRIASESSDKLNVRTAGIIAGIVLLAGQCLRDGKNQKPVSKVPTIKESTKQESLQEFDHIR